MDDIKTLCPILQLWHPKDSKEMPPIIASQHAERLEETPNITVEYSVAWFVILIIFCGALFAGKNNHGIKNNYRSAPYGICIPSVRSVGHHMSTRCIS